MSGRRCRVNPDMAAACLHACMHACLSVACSLCLARAVVHDPSPRFYCFPLCRFTGADLYALCSDAWMTALKRSISHLEQQQQLQQQQVLGSAWASCDSSAVPDVPCKEEDEEVAVMQADFLAAVESLKPSLSREEVAKYERIRDEYDGRTAVVR